MTVRLGIVGWPVGHTLSPRIFGCLAEKLKVELSYRPIAVEAAELSGELRSLKDDGYLGVNVTIPHKQAALKVMDALTPEAEAIGAVNTVRFRGGKATGHNTDADGFLDALALAGISVKGRDAVVFGAGGAARAVGWALGKAGASEVRVSARKPAQAKQLAAALKKSFPKSKYGAGPASSAALWVNATPLGMEGFPDRSPIEDPALRCEAAYDLVYGRQTPFLRAARLSGAKAVDGLSMLAAQALRGWEFWFKPLGEGRRKALALEVIKELS